MRTFMWLLPGTRGAATDWNRGEPRGPFGSLGRNAGDSGWNAAAHRLHGGWHFLGAKSRQARLMVPPGADVEGRDGHFLGQVPLGRLNG
jgi:hypothetical protein